MQRDLIFVKKLSKDLSNKSRILNPGKFKEGLDLNKTTLLEVLVPEYYQDIITLRVL